MKTSPDGERKNESQSSSIHEERPLTSIIKNMPVFGESEIAPSSVVFCKTNYF